MKQKVNFLTASVLPVVLTLSSASMAGNEPTCYEVDGFVDMENVSETVQIGTIELMLINKTTGVTEFDKMGDLVGTITGADMATQTTFLSHSAKFSPGNKFTSTGDTAVVNYQHPEGPIRDVVRDEYGNQVLDEVGQPIPCSYRIIETLSELKKASGFFAKARKLEQNIIATGYVSNCPGKNQNYFELSGEFCKK